MKKIFLGISYVSLWIIAWGTIGSLIDFPLLQANIYSPGTIGQFTTFSGTGLLSVYLAKLLYPNFFKE